MTTEVCQMQTDSQILRTYDQIVDGWFLIEDFRSLAGALFVYRK